nr:MAG TPA: hypothetical protein [Caudoviricetes sp.]
MSAFYMPWRGRKPWWRPHKQAGEPKYGGI